MTTIKQDAPHETFINYFIVEPEHAEELAELLITATEEVMRHVPGFISANIHLSKDHCRIVNYAQWESAAVFEAMLTDPVARIHMDKCADLATSFDLRLYTVESVHSAPTP
jgi:quinol monooxygenase YgiN